MAEISTVLQRKDAKAQELKPVHNSFQALPQVRNIEINQQTETFVGQAEIRQQLRTVNWQDFFNSFHFDDYRVIDDKVEPITAVEP